MANNRNSTTYRYKLTKEKQTGHKWIRQKAHKNKTLNGQRKYNMVPKSTWSTKAKALNPEKS